MTQWIEHRDKGYPDLPLDTLVQVRFADGYETKVPPRTVEFWDANWSHSTPLHRSDITHYRVVTK